VDPKFYVNSWRPLSIWWTQSEQSMHYARIWHFRVKQGSAVTWVRWGGKCIYGKQFQPVCYIPTKVYYNWWKFDKVLTQNNFSQFFLRHSVYIYIYSCLSRGIYWKPRFKEWFFLNSRLNEWIMFKFLSRRVKYF